MRKIYHFRRNLVLETTTTCAEVILLKMNDDFENSSISRLHTKKQSLDDMYSAPANFLEIDVLNPQTTIVQGKKKFTDYEIRMKTNLPVFKVKESSVRRRYSDFEWLRNELERDSKIIVPPLPSKAWKRQVPFFGGDEGIFEEKFIEERRKGLEIFVNKIAGHPLAQNEKCLHMFLQEETIDRNYTPGKDYFKLYVIALILFYISV
ncbi:hypothetical protein PVAND_003843 [Polypedilum vanderplanki]|uniref:Sorting nexin-3 n=1 Tax=Polypedilum vanderplanki TaxID=319348 RepID=A0A9J6BWD0_POLVA|nr:hypothetical protein PVAND_003843 [Polypedilum vanderplanki]